MIERDWRDGEIWLKSRHCREENNKLFILI